jgi:hypothetical protein
MGLIDREKLMKDIIDAPFWHRVVIRKNGVCQAENTDAINRSRVMGIIDAQPEVDTSHLTCNKCAHCRVTGGESALCVKIGGPLFGKEITEDVTKWYCADAERENGNL